MLCYRFTLFSLISTAIFAQRGLDFLGEINQDPDDPYADVAPGETPPPIDPICEKMEEIVAQLDSSPWSLLDDEGKAEVMSIVPKTVTEEMVAQIAAQYMKQMKIDMEFLSDSCPDNPQESCEESKYILAQMDADPPKFLPLEVEEALLSTLPKKVTPLMLKMVADVFFADINNEFNELAEMCTKGPAPACRKFIIPNGNVTYGSGIKTANITCKSGYKTRIGNNVADLVESANQFSISCTEEGKWDKLPNCYACEIGWSTNDNVPGCYRLFPGPPSNIEFHRKTCIRHLGDLASIHSKQEIDFIVDEILKSQESALIGYTKAQGADWTDSKWSDGTPQTVLQWVEEPEQLSGVGCSAVKVVDGNPYVVPVDCDQPEIASFICKRVPTKIES